MVAFNDPVIVIKEHKPGRVVIVAFESKTENSHITSKGKEEDDRRWVCKLGGEHIDKDSAVASRPRPPMQMLYGPRCRSRVCEQVSLRVHRTEYSMDSGGGDTVGVRRMQSFDRVCWKLWSALRRGGKDARFAWVAQTLRSLAE